VLTAFDKPWQDEPLEIIAGKMGKNIPMNS
jgi:hypothetical protein